MLSNSKIKHNKRNVKLKLFRVKNEVYEITYYIFIICTS